MLVLFDIDGTLVHSDGVGRRSFDRACLDVLGVEDALGELRLDGMTDRLILAHIANHRLGRALDDAETEAVLRAYLRHLEAEMPKSRLVVLDGAFEAIAWCEERGATIGLATGNIREGARLKLTPSALWQRFPFGGFGCDATERAELVRVGIRRGEERAGRRFRRDEILVIGDTPKDIAAAHAAGATAIAIATGAYDRESLRAAGADAVFESLREWTRAAS